MNDLLPLVKGPADSHNHHPSGPARDQYVTFDVEAAVSLPGTGTSGPQMAANNKALASFHCMVDEIQADLTSIKARKQQLQKVHEDGRAAVTQRDVQALQDAMQSIMNEVNRIVLGTKAKLEALAANNAESLQIEGQGMGTATERTRSAITAGLRNKLCEVMEQFSTLRCAINDEYRDTVRTRIFVVSGQHCADEDVDRIIDAGEAEGIFQKAMLVQGRGRVLDLLNDIQARHHAIKRLDVSLLELHQVFVDMATLVELQGQKMDSIEKQVARSVSYVEGGAVQLVEARVFQKKSRQCTFNAISLGSSSQS